MKVRVLTSRTGESAPLSVAQERAAMEGEDILLKKKN
jgi:hypothetical protein